jgi:large subunit ribosomal protein L21
MYAVIEAGGKQYRVELGSEIEIDRLDVEPGASIELGRVLLVADGDEAQVGMPVVDGARVTADVLRQDRGEKIDVFKYRPKARRRVKKGHRADLTIVRVSDIVLNGRSAAESARAESQRADAERAAAEQEAARRAAADQALAAKLAADQQAADKKTTAKTADKPATAKPSATKTTAAKPATAKNTTSAPKGAARTKKDE